MLRYVYCTILIYALCFTDIHTRVWRAYINAFALTFGPSSFVLLLFFLLLCFVPARDLLVRLIPSYKVVVLILISTVF